MRTLAIGCYSFAYRSAPITSRGRGWNTALYPVISAPGAHVDGVVIHPVSTQQRLPQLSFQRGR